MRILIAEDEWLIATTIERALLDGKPKIAAGFFVVSHRGAIGDIEEQRRIQPILDAIFQTQAEIEHQAAARQEYAEAQKIKEEALKALDQLKRGLLLRLQEDVQNQQPPNQQRPAPPGNEVQENIPPLQQQTLFGRGITLIKDLFKK